LHTAAAKRQQRRKWTLPGVSWADVNRARIIRISGQWHCSSPLAMPRVRPRVDHRLACACVSKALGLRGMGSKLRLTSVSGHHLAWLAFFVDHCDCSIGGRDAKIVRLVTFRSLQWLSDGGCRHECLVQNIALLVKKGCA
jgi:hypothetical protein